MGRRIAWVSFDEIGRDCMVRAAGIGAEVVATVTLPQDLEPKPSGWCSFVDAASDVGAELITSTDVNDDRTVEALRRCRPDAIFVVGWSQLVGEGFLALAPQGVFGMHPSMLPKHRGRAPIPWAIISGLTKTGVTLFEIVDPTADSGGVVAQMEVEIAPDETATSLYAKVADAHLDLLGASLLAILDGNAERTPQDPRRASEWVKRRPRDGIIDWDTRLAFLDAWIRAQTRPYPGAFTYFGDRKVVVWRARPSDSEGGATAGTIVRGTEDGVEVRCGDGSLVLEEVDVEGVGTLVAAQIGAHLPVGTALG